MGNYSNVKRSDGKDMMTMIERLLRNQPHVVQQHAPVINIDANHIANTVSQVVADSLKNLPKVVYNNSNGAPEQRSVWQEEDTKSLEKLAESMTVQRGNSQSNFEDLGGVNKTKKDEKEVKNTIDLLKGLDD